MFQKESAERNTSNEDILVNFNNRQCATNIEDGKIAVVVITLIDFRPLREAIICTKTRLRKTRKKLAKPQSY